MAGLLGGEWKPWMDNLGFQPCWHHENKNVFVRTRNWDKMRRERLLAIFELLVNSLVTAHQQKLFSMQSALVLWSERLHNIVRLLVHNPPVPMLGFEISQSVTAVRCSQSPHWIKSRLFSHFLKASNEGWSTPTWYISHLMAGSVGGGSGNRRQITWGINPADITRTKMCLYALGI